MATSQEEHLKELNKGYRFDWKDKVDYVFEPKRGLAGHALGIALFSFDGRVFLCINAASDSVPDLDVVATGIADSFAELAEIAGVARGSAPAVSA